MRSAATVCSFSRVRSHTYLAYPSAGGQPATPCSSPCVCSCPALAHTRPLPAPLRAFVAAQRWPARGCLLLRQALISSSVPVAAP
nr:unnamed protein product [Digitaria exilis]